MIKTFDFFLFLLYTMTVEIENPIDITIQKQDNHSTEQAETTPTVTPKKREATEKQRRGLEKAREAKRIKEMARQLLSSQSPSQKPIQPPLLKQVTKSQPKSQPPLRKQEPTRMDIVSEDRGGYEFLQNLPVQDMKDYVVPLILGVGLVGMVAILKKKNQNSSSGSPTQEGNVPVYSTLQLGF
jgi:hypothetical protein